MNYPKLVERAQATAIRLNLHIEVYHNLNHRWWNNIPKYGYCNSGNFNLISDAGKEPLVRLLLILPDGTVVQ